MKKITLLSFAMAFALCCHGQTVTTTVMNETVDGSLLKIIKEAPAKTHVDIKFDMEGHELIYEGASAIQLVDKDITIDGTNAKDGKRVVLKSAGTTADVTKGGSMFKVGKGAKLVLKNIELTQFQKIALYCTDNGVLTVDNSLFYNNIDIKKEKGNNGGVLRHSGGTVTFTRCMFKGNEANGTYGGGVICAYNTADMPLALTVSGCTFTQNCSTSGGAIAVNLRTNNTVPTVKIENCTFANNYVADRGGAIYMQDAHTAANNAASFSPVIVNNTFVGNVSGNATSDDGGAINFWARGTAVVMTPIFFNNLLQANYYDPWNKNRANDIKCFYLDGDKVGDQVMTGTVNIKAANNIFGAAEDSFVKSVADKNNNSVADFESADIFMEKVANPIDGEEETVHYTAKLYDNGVLALPAIKENSIVIAKGVTSFEGIEAPKVDQFGNARPAVPSVGAVEYVAEPTSIKVAKTGHDIIIAYANNMLKVSGLTKNCTLALYNSAGQCVMTAVVTDNQTLHLDSLAKGIYLARIDGQSVKFVKS